MSIDTAAEPARLRIVTFPKPPEPPPCDGSYTCACPDCIADRDQAVRRGVRARRKSVPIRRRIAA